MIYKIALRALLAVLLIVILLVCSVHAQTITGKVVGVSDGDTITVLPAQPGKLSYFTIMLIFDRAKELKRF